MTDNPEGSSRSRDETTELAGSLAEITQILFTAGSVTETLQRVADLAVETIEGCDLAGIFLREGHAITTPVITEPLVLEIDAFQRRSGEGPCLDAIAGVCSVYAHDLAEEPRWPSFAPMATSAGIRSALAFPLSATQGALNLYGYSAKSFDVGDRANGQVLATLSDLAASTAETHELEERQMENLRAALVTREMIGQATGILMAREKITADQAFDVLRRASQHLNVRLRDVARDVVETGETPAPVNAEPIARQIGQGPTTTR
jgi:hypothetical protein